jgi:hypothetical protein
MSDLSRIRPTRSLLVAAVFLIGCATGGAASQYVASANAQAPTGTPGTTQWAYYCLTNAPIDDLEVLANAAGREGWELAASALSGGSGTSSPVWCFKRPYR